MTGTSNNAGEKRQAAMYKSGAVMTTQTEQAIRQSKATFEQIATNSRVAMEQSLKTVNAIATMTRGNVEALLDASRLASGGLQLIAHEIANYSKRTLERTTSAARALTLAKTAPELMQLQSEFARVEFDNAVSEVSALSETMFETMTAIFEPLQKQAIAAAQIKDLMTES